MNGAPPGDAVSAWSEAQKSNLLRYLERLTAVPSFAAAPRSCRLLRYLVEHKLAGDADQVSEYAIGLDVFEKPPSFDPRSEATVRVQVSRLRKALADYYAAAGASDPWRIELPPRGYVVAIETPAAPVSGAPAPVPAPPSALPRRRLWTAAVLCAALAVAALLLWRLGPMTHPHINSVAVLPFANLTGDPHQDYLTDGITEQLTDALAHIPSLRVVARTSAFQFRGKAADIREIGRKLDADAVIEGSLRSLNGRIQLTVQVNRTSDGYHIFSRVFDGELRDLSRLQTDMAQPVVGILRPGTEAARGHTPPAEAYDLFLRSQAVRGLGTAAAYEQGLEYLSQAVEIDPQYADAYAALAGVYVTGALTQSHDPLHSIALAKAAAARALELDPSNGRALGAQGYGDAIILLDWKRGEEELRRAVALLPQSALMHNWLGLLLEAEGRFPEALAELKTAERLDPLAPAAGVGVGLAYYMARRYDDALRQFIQVRDLHPETIAVRPFIGAAWEAKGDYEKAMVEYKSVETQIPSQVESRIAHLLAVMGKREEAKVLRDRLAHPPPDAGPANAFDIAAIDAALGDRDQAFAWLDIAYQQRTIWFLKVHPMLDPIRDDPRYRALLHKAGFD